MTNAHDEPAAQREYDTSFAIPGMDCPSEERLIRMALEDVPGVLGLHFDLDNRHLRVRHGCDAADVLSRIQPLGFGARLEHTAEATAAEEPEPTDTAAEARVLKQLLVINAVMFVVELSTGIVAESTALIADSLDMFADATVYGLSLLAVGRAAAKQRRAARISGWLQLALALGALTEVGRSAVTGSEPVDLLMISIATVALVANLTCVALLAKHRKGGIHLRASWIFSTNDALANIGVIVAGILVMLTGGAWPDLVVGAAVGLLVLLGAFRILRLRPQNA